MEEHHAAIFKIDFKVLTKMLDLEGAVIRRVYVQQDEYFNPQWFCLVIEHPDLPVVKESERLNEITPTMQMNYGADGSLLSIERASPEKQKHKEDL